MLFTIQAHLEDYLNKRNLADSDGYAVQLANLYFHHRPNMDTDVFLRKVRRIRTVFFANNGIRDRAQFEKALVDRLDRRFKKKLDAHNLSFPGGVEVEKKRLQRLHRRSIKTLLLEFKRAVEARAIDGFWRSRKKGNLMPNPERIAQTNFALFAMGVLGDRGILLREMGSGIGFVDIGVVFSSTLHLVEIKVLTHKFVGPAQLEQYMKIEGRKEGSLLVIDTRQPENKLDLPDTVKTPSGIIKIYPVDVNPPPPSSLG
jgi:hypothetical protein